MARDDKETRADRGLRDEANVGPDPRRARELTPMRELDRFRVADGEPDIRGWRVFTSAGRELGRIEDLLVDTEAGEVVMLDVDLRRDDRHTLAPIRAAWIDREHERVIIDSHELETEQGVPTLARRGALSDDDVRQFGDRYDRAYGDRALEGDRDYHVRHHADDLRFRRRRADDAATAAAAAAPVVTAQPVVRPAEREVVVHDSTRVEQAADAPHVVEQRPARSEEARTVNATLGGIAPAPIVVTGSGRAPTVVERHARSADDAAAADRAARQRELEAYDSERRRQVRYPTLNAPAPTAADTAAPRGRVIEEVVVRRREVGPDETERR